jgi:hypothetical protein
VSVAPLLYAGTTALNQNHEHNNKENAGSDANQCSAIHKRFPSESWVEKVIIAQRRTKPHRRLRSKFRALLDARAAALDENHQHNDEQNSGCDPD